MKLTAGPCLAGLAAGTALLLTGCSSTVPTGPPAPTPTYSMVVAPTTVTFPATTVGTSSPSQVITVYNNGNQTINLTSVALSGPNASSFSSVSTCGSSLATVASCTVTVTFNPTASGTATATLTATSSNATNSPMSSTITATATAIASSANTVDCSVGTSLCFPTFSAGGTLPTDPIAAGGFHGYADPSLRKDPNSGILYIAYSWPHTYPDGTHVVDLHLAQSFDLGASFTYVGPLYKSVQSSQTASTAYSAVNYSSTETIDLLPIPLTGASAGQTLWVQAHQSYLVKPTAGIYDQLDLTSIISVSAVQLPTPAGTGAGTALLALGSPSTPEARLGAASTDPSRAPTQTLTTLSPATAKCANFGQAALWYQTGTLYLALECSETPGGGNLDAHELSHFLYSTTPTGTDASKWAWAYVGEFATGAQAAKLGLLPSEGITYQFFTEPQFVQTKAGQLSVLMTPAAFAPASAQQPVIQFGCRLVPITITPTSVALAIDPTTGAPVVTAKITETDLATAPNEGPAACTYEPAAANGIIIGRKFENDPILGFYIYPIDTQINP